LRTLHVERVRATFFLTGDFVRVHHDASLAITDAGHLIGNHTVSHPHARSLSAAQLRREIIDAERRISNSLQVHARPWFRFPFGEYDARTLRVVNGLAYAAIGWTVDTLGWRGTHGGGTTSAVVSRVMSTLRPGAIVLMHVGANPDDGSTLDADALPELIHAVRRAGYGFTTLDSLLR